MPQDLSTFPKVKSVISERGGKVVFTKMGITRSYVVQIQNFLYEKKALFKMYNFVEEVELKFWIERAHMIGLAEAI